MLGKFFNSFYYGKAGKGDYTPENLPQNRVQLFFEVLRVRWSALIRLNLLYILFWLPAILWSLLNFFALQNIAFPPETVDVDAAVVSEAGDVTSADMVVADMVDGVAATGAGDAGGVDAGGAGDAAATATPDNQAISLIYMWLLLLWPCIAITGPATAGVSYVTRNWARDQHSFMLSDFKDAVKENWKQALPISIITGFMPLIVFVCYQFYGGMSAQSVLYVIPQMVVIILFVIWLLMLELVYTLMVTYKLSFGNLIRNSLILSIGRLPTSILMRLASLAVAIIGVALMWFVPSITGYVMLVLVLYYLLFGFAFSRFIFASYANAVCDKFINPRIEGAEVNRGLRQTTDEDYEIDPTLPQPGQRQDDDEDA